MTTLRLILIVVVPAVLASLTLASDEEPTAWSKTFTPPEGLKTSRVMLEPLGPQHAELDHRALMSSREHLQRTLHWGDWPADNMTVEDNRKDLEKHAKEFEDREAYAYTVLSPDGKRCLGCLYMKPAGRDLRAAMLAYWVVEEELAGDLDKHLVEHVVEWMEKDWPIDRAVLPLHSENARGIKVAEELGLRRVRMSGEMVQFFWQRK